VAESGTRTDPLVAFRFELVFDQKSFGGFSECTGLGLEVQVQDYAEGGKNDAVHRLPSRSAQTNVVLKRGVVDRKLFDWLFAHTQGAISPVAVSIRVLHPDTGEVAAELRLSRAFPCKWTGPELSAAQSSAAVETLELCHQGLEWAK
jgi:phage tail-like protein